MAGFDTCFTIGVKFYFGVNDVLKATHIGQGESGVKCDSADDMVNYAVTTRNGNSTTWKAWPW